MRTLTISARKTVQYAIPVELDDDIADRAEAGDQAAWREVEKKVEETYHAQKHWLDEDDFEPSDFEIMS